MSNEPSVEDRFIGFFTPFEGELETVVVPTDSDENDEIENWLPGNRATVNLSFKPETRDFRYNIGGRGWPTKYKRAILSATMSPNPDGTLSLVNTNSAVEAIQFGSDDSFWKIDKWITYLARKNFGDNSLNTDPWVFEDEDLVVDEVHWVLNAAEGTTKISKRAWRAY